MNQKIGFLIMIRVLWRLIALGLWLVLMLIVLSPFFRRIQLILGLYRPNASEARMKLLQLAARIIGLRVFITGDRPRISQGSYVLLANHVSYLDIIALGSLLPARFLAKQDINSWPILGWLAKWSDSIFVDRSSVATRVDALRRIRTSIGTSPILIFPEGTTTSAEAPASCFWYRGNAALLADARGDVPLYIAGLHYRQHKKAAWIDDESLIPHLLKVLTEPNWDLFIAMERIDARILTEGLAQRSEHTWKKCRVLCAQAKALAYIS